jgi:hypothetical protein
MKSVENRGEGYGQMIRISAQSISKDQDQDQITGLLAMVFVLLGQIFKIDELGAGSVPGDVGVRGADIGEPRGL